MPRVYYDFYITGPEGAHILVFTQDHSDEVLAEAKAKIRFDGDVLSLREVKRDPPEHVQKHYFYDVGEDEL